MEAAPTTPTSPICSGDCKGCAACKNVPDTIYVGDDAEQVEEPTDPGNYSGYCRIQRDGGLVLAQGENLHTLEEFQHALAAGGVDVPQPDASNCGGITGWLKVAALAEAHGLEVSSHGMQELHVSLVAGVRNGGWLEVHSFPIDQYTMREVVVTAGRTEAPDIPGCGVQFNWQKLRPYLVLGTES